MKDLIDIIASHFNGEWKLLAQELPDMKANRIRAIDRDEPTTDLKQRAMLHVWYDSQVTPCWEDVLQALKGLEQGRLAGKIRRCLDYSNIPNCVKFNTEL